MISLTCTHQHHLAQTGQMMSSGPGWTRTSDQPIMSRLANSPKDIIKTVSGKYLVVHSFTGIFEHYKEIIQFCVIQDNLKSIKIKIIVSKEFHENILNSIKNDLNKYTHGELNVDFQIVNKIAATPSGKPQIIISYLSKKNNSITL